MTGAHNRVASFGPDAKIRSMLPNDESGVRPAPAGAERVESLYRELGPMLRRTIVASFAIPQDEAEAMVQEAFLAYVMTSGPVNAADWISEMACGKARKYWLRELPADASDEERRLLQEVIFNQDALAPLPPPARKAVRLRYHAGKTFAEIALELKVTPCYARKLIAHALRRLRTRQNEAGR